MTRLTLSFFGTFQATLDERPLQNFRSSKVQGLLIYLALTPEQPHDRDVLAALFWPEEPEAVARQNLRQSLFRLRKVLGDVEANKDTPFLLVSRTTAQFNPASDYQLDVAGFLAAVAEGEWETATATSSVQAVSLYHNDLLPSFACDSRPFEDWLHQERERLHRLAINALHQLTADSLDQADFQTARRFAQQQLFLEPWREEAHRQLMQALAALGERTAALAQYERCRAILADQLGVEPAPETQKLARRIQETPLERPAAATAVAATQQPLQIPFVGRQAEYETLIKAYRQAAQHGLQVVTVQGQAGIGKTRLSEQFASWAATQGADVLIGRSFQTSSGLSYQPIIHLLRQRIERENAPEDLLSDFWLSQLTRLLPEVRDRYPDLPEPTQEENTARQHLFEAVARLLQALAARRPLVLFMDDWHWADTASLDLLHYAAVRWAEERLPILILLTLRQEALRESAVLPDWLTRLQHATETVSLSLEGLTPGDTQQLLHTLIKPEIAEADAPLTRFSDWLFAETEGQPLFLTETLKALVADGLVQRNTAATGWHVDWATFAKQERRVVQSIQAIIQGWLARISAEARELLTAVAILNQHATFDHLCHVAGLAEMSAIAALDDLLNKQLLQEVHTAYPAHDPLYSFTHQKVSEAVYAEAGAARRRRLHRRAYHTLLTTAAAADLAHHALNAGLLAEAIHHSLIAGNEAMALFATRVAIGHYETAWHIAEREGWPPQLSGADRQTLYTALGRAYELTEAWPQAQTVYAAMVAHAQAIEATAMICLGLNHLATVYLNGYNDSAQALSLLAEAQQVAAQNGDKRGLAETEWNLSLAAVQAQNAKLALHHSERALALAQELGHSHLVARCMTSVAQGYAFLRQWDKALPYVQQTHQMYLAEGDLVMAANSQRGLGFLQLFSGNPAASLATLQETFAFSRRIENVMGEADCAWILARAHLECGDYGQAIKLAQQAVSQTQAIGHAVLQTMARAAWGIVQRTVLDRAAETTLLDLLAQATAEAGSGWTDPIPELCALYASVGDWAQAYRYARQIRHPLHEDEPLLPFNLTGWYETEALLRGGDGDLARAGVVRLSEAAGGNRRYRLIVLRSQAVLAQWDGEAAQALSHLEDALTLAREIDLPGEAWPILGELGKLYAALGEDEQAREAYGEAGIIIRRLAETIDDKELREGFVTAVAIHAILEANAATKNSEGKQ